MKKLILIGLILVIPSLSWADVVRCSVTVSYNDVTDFGGEWSPTWASIAFGHTEVEVANAGFRFLNITIPQGSIIDTAFLYFESDANYPGSYPDTVFIAIYCEDIADASIFTTLADFNARTKTTAYIDWIIPTSETWSWESWYFSPDISAPIQEVIDRDDWVSGNDLVVFFMDNGTPYGSDRACYSMDYEGVGSSPKLIIFYSEEEPPVSSGKKVMVR